MSLEQSQKSWKKDLEELENGRTIETVQIAELLR